MAIGSRIDKTREKEIPNTELVTPHGATVVVSAKRAETLLNRPAIRFGDGVARSYARAGESNEVEDIKSGANPPRRGDGRNTPKDDE